MKHLTILGATGSIGTSTLEIVAAHPDRFRIEALTAGANLELFARQIERFSPRLAVVHDEKLAAELAAMLPAGVKPEIMFGVEGLIAAATMTEAEMVVAAIVGAAGLVPTAAAIKAGKDIALANKETLVTAGHLFMELIEQHGVRLLSGGQRTQCRLPVNCRTPLCRYRQNHPDCLWRSVPQPAAAISCRCHHRGCAESSELEHGAQDNH